MIPHLPYWGSCVMATPTNEFYGVRDCVAKALEPVGNDGGGEDSSDMTTECFLRSQVGVHGAKSKEDQIAAGRYFAKFPVDGNEIEDCLTHGVSTVGARAAAAAASTGGSTIALKDADLLKKDGQKHIRLVHFEGYARTRHSRGCGASDDNCKATAGQLSQLQQLSRPTEAHPVYPQRRKRKGKTGTSKEVQFNGESSVPLPLVPLVDPETKRWRTFNLSDCLPGQDTGGLPTAMMVMPSVEGKQGLMGGDTSWIRKNISLSPRTKGGRWIGDLA